MVSDRDDPAEQDDPGENSGSSESHDFAAPQPSARTNPLIDSLAAGLASSDQKMAEQCGIGLALIGANYPGRVSTIIGRLVPQFVNAPGTTPLRKTLGSLVDEHGREIRGALMTETGYTNARELYGRLEHTEGWEIDDLDIEKFVDTEEPSFFSAVMQLVELGEDGRDPLDSDAWTLFIQELPGEGGEVASEEEIQIAAEREGSRPRTVRKRHERLNQIANSRTFRTIEANSRFDELEVLSTVRDQRFASVIRTRGRIGAQEYAIALRLCDQIDAPAFRRLLTDQLREWERLESDGLVRVFDWGDTPRPWIATEFVDRTLAGEEQLTTREALDHAQILTRSLVDLHRQGVVHGGIDPGSVGYPPNTLDGVVEPMLDHIGLLPVYTRYAEPAEYLDPRFGAPEWFDESYGSIDRLTDIYQLGAVLYTAFTGRAFDDGSAAPDAAKSDANQPPPPSSLNSDLSGQLDEVIAKATAKEKLLRYETAIQFHHEVRAVCADLG